MGRSDLVGVDVSWVMEFQETFHFDLMPTHRLIQTNFIQSQVVQIVRQLEGVQVVCVLDFG